MIRPGGLRKLLGAIWEITSMLAGSAGGGWVPAEILGSYHGWPATGVSPSMVMGKTGSWIIRAELTNRTPVTVSGSPAKDVESRPTHIKTAVERIIEYFIQASAARMVYVRTRFW